MGDAVAAFGRSNVNQTLGIALQELRSRRMEELEKKRLGVAGGYLDLAKGADKRAADLADIQNPVLKARGETEILKANVEKTAIEESEAKLNQKVDPTLNPMFMNMAPEQQRFATEMMKRSRILDKDGLATNRDLMTLVNTVETDSKLFNQFSNIGVQSMKNNIQGIYQELQKATESGNEKKVAELTAKAEQMQEQFNNMVNFKDKHSKNLDAWGKLPVDTQNALAEMGVGPRTYDVEKEGQFRAAVKDYLTLKNMEKEGTLTTTKKNYDEYKAQHPDYKGDILEFKKAWDKKDVDEQSISLAQKDYKVMSGAVDIYEKANEIKQALLKLRGQEQASPAITLPPEIKTTSQAKKYLMEKQGMSDQDAIKWLEDNI